jgi:hypothetical protein
MVDKELNRHLREGLPTTMTAASKINRKLVRAAENEYGSWGLALNALGVEYIPKRKLPDSKIKWSKEKILNEILRIKETDGDLSGGTIQKEHSKLYQAAIRKFGSWKIALQEVGIDVEAYNKLTYWTKESLISELERIYKETNDLSVTYLRDSGYSTLPTTAISLFGSYEVALIEAGFDPNDIQRKKPVWTDRELKNLILNVYNETGTFSERRFRENHSNIISVCQSKFGGWYNTLKHFGLPTEEVKVCRLNKAAVGYQFQSLLKQVFQTINLKFDYEKQHGKVRPDFTLNESTWIDAKLSSWTALSDGTLTKYCAKIPFLIIVYLRGNYMKESNKVNFIPVDDFFPALIEKGRSDLVEQIITLRENVNSIELSS